MSGQRASLLALAGELRNPIYRYVLVSNSKVQVTDEWPPQASLLKVSRTIRKEAMSIFLGENTFALDTPPYSSDGLLRWTNWARRMHSKYQVRITGVGSCDTDPGPDSWHNLLVWLKRFHERSVTHILHEPSKRLEQRADQMLVGCMFAMVKRMRDKPWAIVKALLEEQHHVLAAINAEWEAEAKG
ncbi:hypothetical protein BAUCODRAFT_23771 [Baudoinia panamericana UAMH 10762]|uniref:Uncharacterized protein n=1 Tax=Baudoinia panamericana (strain UAMH 10762) TaxID=717646 RepID=M2LSN8_BAUPA|nr:uncharacterized protein BAUCODRAFT_23771 [Baudoinia panamericana UAMH 10762]EMC97487.1 hypothetical protein BAUCODRAFT_23771 [Baudoinia panamericana UAMH 10762]